MDLYFTSARQFVLLEESSELAPPASSPAAAAATEGTLAATPVMLDGAPVSADLPDAECCAAGLPPPDRPNSEENQLGRRPVSYAYIISKSIFSVSLPC